MIPVDGRRMSDLRAAVKLLRQKIQRARVAHKRDDRARVTLELDLAELAAKALAQLTDEPMEADRG